MNLRCWYRTEMVVMGLAAGILASWATVAHAQTPGSVLASAVMGQTYFSTNGQHWEVLQVGDSLGLGDSVYSGPDSAIDLFLGPDAGYLRLAEKSQVTLEDYAVDASFRQSNLSLILKTGTVLGFSNQLENASEYKIKMSHGVVGVASSQFRIDGRGFFVCLDGALIYAYPEVDDALKSEVMKAPPACYYTRGNGVKTAPAALIQEVLIQSTGELPKQVKRQKKARFSAPRNTSAAPQSLTDPSGFGEGSPGRN